MSATLGPAQYLGHAVSAKRRMMGAESPHDFAKIYLGHHVVQPPSQMHLEMFAKLRGLSEQRGSRIALAAPRGHAKTTVISLAYVLWCLLYRKEMFILIVSATREQAVQILADLTRELKSNPRLIADFPEICEPLITGRTPAPGSDNAMGKATSGVGVASSGGGGGMVKVRGHHLVLPNGTCVRVLGARQGVRGMKHRQHRPSLIIGDDLEELEMTMSDDQRQKTLDWFQKTLLKAGNPQTNVVVVGTILHYDSLLANLTQTTPGRGGAGGWDGKVYRAVEAFSLKPAMWDHWESIRFSLDDYEGHSGVDASRRYLEANREAMLEGTKVLWPEVESYEKLMEIRADEGRSSFQSEKQNEPLDPDKCLFRESQFRYWDAARPGSGGAVGQAAAAAKPYFHYKGHRRPPQFDGTYADAAELLATLGPDARICGAVDPSLGERGSRGDYSAVITLAQDTRTGVMYVINADIARRSPDELIEVIVRLSQTYCYDVFGVETNLFRGLFADQISERVRVMGGDLNIEKIENTKNKQLRIASIEPLVTQGMVRFSQRQQILLEQLQRFPLGSHDDGPDALEMAIRVAQQERHLTVIEPF